MSAKTVAAIGVFSALAYAGSFVMLAIPNATLSILLVFFAGYCTGITAGGLIGAISASLISLFNPYGMVILPLFAAQILGYVLIGVCGGFFRNRFTIQKSVVAWITLAVMGIVTALLYQIPVSVVDAWFFGPFLERLMLSVPFVLITIVSNLLFFVILFPILAKLQKVAIIRPS